MLTLEEIYPPFALRITCGPIELRVLRDDDIPELVELVRGGVQAPDMPMPFMKAWHESLYSPGTPDGFPSTSLSWWWTQRATFSPDRWLLAFAVRRGGQLVGMQDLSARNFAHTRSLETGSWLNTVQLSSCRCSVVVCRVRDGRSRRPSVVCPILCRWGC